MPLKLMVHRIIFVYILSATTIVYRKNNTNYKSLIYLESHIYFTNLININIYNKISMSRNKLISETKHRSRMIKCVV